MGKKRKLHSDNSNILHSSPTEIVTENLATHPFCLHGPTLLFSSKKGRYFGCSFCRNKSVCTVHIDEEDWKKENTRRRNEKYYDLILKVDKAASWKNFCEVKSQHPSTRAFCNTCQELFIVTQSKKHTKDHRVTSPLTDEQLSHVSSWLPAIEDDSNEAQYIFTKHSVATLLTILKNNSISNIICIGTPSVHEAAQAHEDFESILLDYDTRHHLFYPPNKFLWYNMFNNYLFDGNNDENTLKKFIKNSRQRGICVVIDPPFGGRVEPLVQTLKELSTSYQKICEKTEGIPVIWAFPYFAEPYITNMMADMKMHDYQVQYENHKKFQNKTNKGRKFGSPVRFFTNLPLATINLSNDKNYKYCDKCKYWVSVSNNHCNKCKQCTSKNGMTYRHCNMCMRCIKPTFFHCDACKRCCQKKGHVCGATVQSQSCFNCGEKGHKKSECSQTPQQEKKKRKQA